MASLRVQERGGHRLRAALRRVACSPGSGPRERDGGPPLRGFERAPWGANAGGTAEGFAFRPGLGAEGFFAAGDRREDFPFGRAAVPRTRVFKLVVESMTGKIRPKK